MSTVLPRTQTIRTYLVSAMRSGVYANCSNLPPEKELAEQLGISRTQLRDALAALEREGFITRRHGVGTLINRHVLNVKNRMDMETEFLDMIRLSGYEPGCAFVRAEEDTADETIAQALQIEVHAPVLRAARLCTADGRPAIYCEDVFARDLIHRSYTLQDLQAPIFHFLQHFCGVVPYLDLTELHPVTADTTLAQLFHLPEGTAMLNMTEVDYDVDRKPILFSSQFFADGIIRHTILRKKL